jgi:hypothetical protein
MTYWWVTADYNGSTLILGAYNSEQEAMEAGYAKLDMPFDTVELDTRDRVAARDKIKARRLGKMSIPEAMQKARYKIPETEPYKQQLS